jgi:hypothetical protein
MLTELQYNQLVPYIPVIRLTVEHGSSVTNQPSNLLNEIWIAQGNPPANLGCSACLNELYRCIWNLIKEYEQSKG